MLRVPFAIVPLSISAAFGQTIIHVPTDAPTIQIAIQQAQPFDTIIVAPDTYFEAINFKGKVIAIQSENPNDPQTVADTIIDAGGVGSAVTLAGTEEDLHSALDGFTITGGTIGIEGHGTTATIRNCVIRANSSRGIKQVHGNIINCAIRDNEGWGIEDCDGTISRCTVDNNWVRGMYGCDGVVADCLITNTRYAPANSGALGQCHGRIERCVISQNGACGLYGCLGYIKQCVISGNTKEGLMLCQGSRIENSVIAGNGGSGFESCSLEVLNCSVTGNKGYGFRGHSGSIKHAIVWANTSGALYSSTIPVLSGTTNPFFVHPGYWDYINNVWIPGDYHLTFHSPYIDAGDPFYGDDPNDPEEDLDGNPRVVGERVDNRSLRVSSALRGPGFR